MQGLVLIGVLVAEHAKSCTRWKGVEGDVSRNDKDDLGTKYGAPLVSEFKDEDNILYKTTRR